MIDVSLLVISFILNSIKLLHSLSLLLNLLYLVRSLFDILPSSSPSTKIPIDLLETLALVIQHAGISLGLIHVLTLSFYSHLCKVIDLLLSTLSGLRILADLLFYLSRDVNL